MEDAATAEISRAQVWQWVRHGVRTKEGSAVTAAAVRDTIAGELDKIRRELGAPTFDACKFGQAASLFEEMVTGEEFAEFLTLAAYEQID
jgi:malate synthase